MYRRWLQQFAEGFLCLGSASSCSHANKKSGVVGRLLQRHRWWNASTTPQRRPSYSEHSVVRNKHYHDRGAGLDHSLEAQCRLLTSSERRQRLLRDVSLGLPTSPSLSTSAATTTGGTPQLASHTTSATDVQSLHALAATHYATWLCGVSRAIRRVPGYANTMFSSLISQRRRRQRRSMKRSSSRISNNATVTTAAHRTQPRIARWRAWRANVSRRTFQRCGDDDSLFTFALHSTPQSKPFLRSVLLRTCMQYEKLNVFSARQLTETIRVKRLRDGLHTLGIVEDPRRVLMNQTTIQHTPFFQKCVKAFPAARRHTKQFEVHAFLMRRRIQKIVALHCDTHNRSSNNTVENESQFDGRHVSHDKVNPSKDKKPKKRKTGSLTAANGGVGVVAAASASPVTSYDILCRNWWLRDGGGQPFRMMDATRSCAYSQEIHTNAAISAVSSPLRQSQWNTVSFETELCHSIDDLMLADQEALAAWAAPRELVLPSGSTSTHSIQEGSPSLDSVRVGDNTSSSPLPPPPPSHLGRLLGIYENTLIAHSPLITDERLEPKQFDYSAHEEIIQKHFADRLRNMETHVDAIPSMETVSSSSPTSMMTRDGQMRPTSLWSASATKRNALMLKRKQQNMPNTLRSLLMTTTSRHSDGPSANAPPPAPSNPAEEALSNRVVPPRLGDSAEYSLLLSKLRRRHPHPCRDISALMTTARRFQHTPRQVFIEKRHEQAFRDAVMREREEQFPQSQQGGQEVGVVSAHTTTADAHQRSSLPLVLHAQEAVGVVADEYLIRQFECENDVLKSLRSQATLALESQEDAVSRVERFESLFNGLRATARSSARDKEEISCAC